MTIIIAGKNPLTLTALAAAVLALSACGGSSDPFESKNTKPAYLGAVATTPYDGSSDDLLTAGLGRAGLARPPPHAVGQPPEPDPRRTPPAGDFQ